MKVLVFLVLSFLSLQANAASDLLYHQNNKSEVVAGSLEKVKQAIRQGKTIRLYMNLGFVEHSMDAGFLTIIGENVFAQIDAIQAQRPNKKTSEIELRSYAQHVGLDSNKSPYEIKWFAVD